MEIYVTITGTEIMKTPNDFELGELVRKRYWELKTGVKVNEVSNEPYVLIPDESGLIIGTNVSVLEELKNDDPYTENGYDKCVMCGKVSPYLTTTHIDQRLGYVEGVGQTCFNSNGCDKDKIF